jgi:hypothetical protein
MGYHHKTTDIDLQEQQDILMKNTLPYIAKSIEASRTTVLTIQHLRIIEKYNEYIHSINMNLHDHLSLLPTGIYTLIHETPFKSKHQTLLKLYCFMSLYFMTHAAIDQAIKNLTDEIQTFLLDIGQEEYMIQIMNGLSWQLKMSQSSLWAMREHKHIVALRRYNKGKVKISHLKRKCLKIWTICLKKRGNFMNYAN